MGSSGKEKVKSGLKLTSTTTPIMTLTSLVKKLAWLSTVATFYTLFHK